MGDNTNRNIWDFLDTEKIPDLPNKAQEHDGSINGATNPSTTSQECLSVEKGDLEDIDDKYVPTKMSIAILPKIHSLKGKLKTKETISSEGNSKPYQELTKTKSDSGITSDSAMTVNFANGMDNVFERTMALLPGGGGDQTTPKAQTTPNSGLENKSKKISPSILSPLDLTKSRDLLKVPTMFRKSRKDSCLNKIKGAKQERRSSPLDLAHCTDQSDLIRSKALLKSKSENDLQNKEKDSSGHGEQMRNSCLFPQPKGNRSVKISPVRPHIDGKPVITGTSMSDTSYHMSDSFQKPFSSSKKAFQGGKANCKLATGVVQPVRPSIQDDGASKMELDPKEKCQKVGQGYPEGASVMFSPGSTARWREENGVKNSVENSLAGEYKELASLLLSNNCSTTQTTNSDGSRMETIKSVALSGGTLLASNELKDKVNHKGESKIKQDIDNSRPDDIVDCAKPQLNISVLNVPTYVPKKRPKKRRSKGNSAESPISITIPQEDSPVLERESKVMDESQDLKNSSPEVKKKLQEMIESRSPPLLLKISPAKDLEKERDGMVSPTLPVLIPERKISTDIETSNKGEESPSLAEGCTKESKCELDGAIQSDNSDSSAGRTESETSKNLQAVATKEDKSAATKDDVTATAPSCHDDKSASPSSPCIPTVVKEMETLESSKERTSYKEIEQRKIHEKELMEMRAAIILQKSNVFIPVIQSQYKNPVVRIPNVSAFMPTKNCSVSCKSLNIHEAEKKIFESPNMLKYLPQPSLRDFPESERGIDVLASKCGQTDNISKTKGLSKEQEKHAETELEKYKLNHLRMPVKLASPERQSPSKKKTSPKIMDSCVKKNEKQRGRKMERSLVRSNTMSPISVADVIEAKLKLMKEEEKSYENFSGLGLSKPFDEKNSDKTNTESEAKGFGNLDVKNQKDGDGVVITEVKKKKKGKKKRKNVLDSEKQIMNTKEFSLQFVKTFASESDVRNFEEILKKPDLGNTTEGTAKAGSEVVLLPEGKNKKKNKNNSGKNVAPLMKKVNAQAMKEMQKRGKFHKKNDSLARSKTPPIGGKLTSQRLDNLVSRVQFAVKSPVIPIIDTYDNVIDQGQKVTAKNGVLGKDEYHEDDNDKVSCVKSDEEVSVNIEDIKRNKIENQEESSTILNKVENETDLTIISLKKERLKKKTSNDMKEPTLGETSGVQVKNKTVEKEKLKETNKNARVSRQDSAESKTSWFERSVKQFGNKRRNRRKQKLQEARDAKKKAVEEERIKAKKKRRSILDEIANSDGFISDTKRSRRSENSDLSSDPSMLSREDRYLQRAMAQFFEMELKSEKQNGSATSQNRQPKVESSARQKANKLKRKALQGKGSFFKKARYNDFQPEVLKSRTRQLTCSPKKPYHKDIAYEQELQRDEERLKAKRKARVGAGSGSEIESDLDTSLSSIPPIEPNRNVTIELLSTTTTISEELAIKAAGSVVQVEEQLKLTSNSVEPCSNKEHTINEEEMCTEEIAVTDNKNAPGVDTSLVKRAGRKGGKKGKNELNDTDIDETMCGCDVIQAETLGESNIQRDEAYEEYAIAPTQPDDILAIPPDVKRLAGSVVKDTGETLLHRAARLGYQEIAMWCLQNYYCDINARDNTGFAPLHECCVTGHITIAKYLLAFGADVSVGSLDGVRPIHDAVENDHIELVRLLLSCGADLNIATYSGVTVFDIAKSKEMKQFLKDCLADLEGTDPEPWHFHGSVITARDEEEDEELGHDLFSNVPSDGESDCDDIIFEMSSLPMLPIFALRLNQDQRQRDYVLVEDVLNRLNMDRKSLKEKLPDSRFERISKKHLLSQIAEFRFQSARLDLSDYPTRKGKLRLVEHSDQLKDMLGVESVTLTTKDMNEIKAKQDASSLCAAQGIDTNSDVPCIKIESVFSLAEDDSLQNSSVGKVIASTKGGNSLKEKKGKSDSISLSPKIKKAKIDKSLKSMSPSVPTDGSEKESVMNFESVQIKKEISEDKSEHFGHVESFSKKFEFKQPSIKPRKPVDKIKAKVLNSMLAERTELSNKSLKLPDENARRDTSGEEKNNCFGGLKAGFSCVRLQGPSTNSKELHTIMQKDLETRQNTEEVNPKKAQNTIPPPQKKSVPKSKVTKKSPKGMKIVQDKSQEELQKMLMSNGQAAEVSKKGKRKKKTPISENEVVKKMPELAARLIEDHKKDLLGGPPQRMPLHGVSMGPYSHVPTLHGLAMQETQGPVLHNVGQTKTGLKVFRLVKPAPHNIHSPYRFKGELQNSQKNTPHRNQKCSFPYPQQLEAHRRTPVLGPSRTPSPFHTGPVKMEPQPAHQHAPLMRTYSPIHRVNTPPYPGHHIHMNSRSPSPRDYFNGPVNVNTIKAHSPFQTHHTHPLETSGIDFRFESATDIPPAHSKQGNTRNLSCHSNYSSNNTNTSDQVLDLSKQSSVDILDLRTSSKI